MSDEQSGMLMRTVDEPDDAARARADTVVKQLFHEHARALKRKFSRVCHQQDKLDDIVQEAFVVLGRALSRPRATTDGVRNPVALLYTIAGHLLKDQMRREIASRHISQPFALASEVADPAMGLDDLMCREESLRLRQEIVDELPEEQRRAVQLRIVGSTPAEIAEELNIRPRKRVYRILRLALERCQRRWRELGIDDDGTS